MKTALTLAFATTCILGVFTTTPPAEASWKRCAGETGICSTPRGNTLVRFGSSPRGRYLQRRVSGKITCARPEFGGDPHPYKKKTCWYWKPQAVKCATESNICRVRGAATATVYFATSMRAVGQKRYKSKRISGGGQITCARPEFGGDPHPYKKKSCWYVSDPH